VKSTSSGLEASDGRWRLSVYSSVEGECDLFRSMARGTSEAPLIVSSKHWQWLSTEQFPHPDVETAMTCSTHSHGPVDVQFPQLRCSTDSARGVYCGVAGAFASGIRPRLGGSGTASVPVVRAPFRIYDSSARAASFSLLSYSTIRSNVSHRNLHDCSSPLNRRTSASSRVILLLTSASRFSCSSFVSSSCSSSSPTRAARLTLKALCAARFWAFRLVGGVSVAGFRPGLGRGGTTHSFLVIMAGVGRPDGTGATAMFGVLADLIARTECADARAVGDPAEEGVDTEGEAMSTRNQM
jgi:hypothetical protein